MGRPLRIEYHGALYHITSRGNERRMIFLKDEDKKQFLKILEEYHDRFGILIHSYVLMDNHYHLILETPEGNLLKVMHGINSRYTGYFNRTYNRTGHLFQGRYKAILVDKDTYLLELSRYILLNPVRAKVVEKPEQYPWSSYRGFIGKKKEDSWVEYAWILDRFGKKKGKSRRECREYTEKDMIEKRRTPFEKLWGQVILGEEEFREKISKILKKKPMSQEIAERKRFEKRPLPESIIGAVAKEFNTDALTIKTKGNRDNIARSAAIYIIQKYSGLSNKEVGKIFGGLHYSAISKASARLRRQMNHNKQLMKIVSDIISHVSLVKT